MCTNRGFFLCGHASTTSGPRHADEVVSYPPPPLRKHQESHENDGQTKSRGLDKAVLVRDTRYQKNLPSPPPCISYAKVPN